MGSAASKKGFTLLFSLSTNRVDPERTKYSEIYPVWSIAITKNGKQLAAATAENKIHLWCLVTFQILISLTGHGDSVWHVEYSPDCRYLASASADGTIRMWEVDTGYPLSIMRGHANWVWSLAFSHDSQRSPPAARTPGSSFGTSGTRCRRWVGRPTTRVFMGSASPPEMRGSWRPAAPTAQWRCGTPNPTSSRPGSRVIWAL